VDTTPFTEYIIDFATPGTYYIHLSMNAQGERMNSECNVVMDGVNLTNSRGGLSCQASSDWFWANIYRRRSLNVTIDAAGEHTLRIHMRNDGLAIDKIVLTDQENYTP